MVLCYLYFCLKVEILFCTGKASEKKRNVRNFVFYKYILYLTHTTTTIVPQIPKDVSSYPGLLVNISCIS